MEILHISSSKESKSKMLNGQIIPMIDKILG